MPLPFLIIGAAAAAAAVGAKKGYDGLQDKKSADSIIEESQKKYKVEKEQLDNVNDSTSLSLEELGNLELKIGQDLERFDRIVEEILNNSKFQKYNNVKINLPQHQLNKIKEVAVTATDYLKTVVGGGVSGAAAGFAVYGGVMALGAASTGTPIAALSGAAAYNATMAAIGGGSLAAGGWGMAGGAMILGGAVVAPVLAVAGIAFAIHGSKALDNALEVREQIDQAVIKIKAAIMQLKYVTIFVKRITTSLQSVYAVFQTYFEYLDELNELIKTQNSEEVNNFISQDDLYLKIQNGYALAAIMAELISVPLFKVRKDLYGKVILLDQMPIIETDAQGIQVVDADTLRVALDKANTDFQQYNATL